MNERRCPDCLEPVDTKNCLCDACYHETFEEWAEREPILPELVYARTRHRQANFSATKKQHLFARTPLFGCFVFVCMLERVLPPQTIVVMRVYLTLAISENPVYITYTDKETQINHKIESRLSTPQDIENQLCKKVPFNSILSYSGKRIYYLTGHRYFFSIHGKLNGYNFAAIRFSDPSHGTPPFFLSGGDTTISDVGTSHED